MTADSVYEKALKVFEKQVHEATQIWYASRTMDEVGLRRKRTIEALNATPLSDIDSPILAAVSTVVVMPGSPLPAALWSREDATPLV